MKYLIIGNKGQLGAEFQQRLSATGHKVTGVDLDELDIRNTEKVINLMASVGPEIVINCAAFNNVDKAETDIDTAMDVNGFAVGALSDAALMAGAKFVHYSSDYVFDGQKGLLYTEEDEPEPISQYGLSKLLGEDMLKISNAHHWLCFRLSWVYGRGQQNFIYKLTQWMKSNSHLKISDDEISVPTYTVDIADLTLKALDRGLHGLYHLTAGGYASRYEVARFFIDEMQSDVTIEPVSKDIFKLPAKRPDFSAMDNGLISRELGIEIPHWKKSLSDFAGLIKSGKAGF